MATNNFKPFATASGANVVSQSDYEQLQSLATGFQSGKASSAQINKALRQSTTMAAVLAQFIADKSGKDVLDDGDSNLLHSLLEAALQEKIIDTVPSASLSMAGITKLSSDTNSTDEKTAATSRAVKAVYDLASKMNIDGIYPIGIVVWFAQNKDPNVLFPGTMWKYIGENKTVRLASASGGDILTTGGADSVTLALGNLPLHSHTFSGNTSAFDYGSRETSTFDYGTKGTNTTGNHQHAISPALSGGGSISAANLSWSGPANTMTGWAGDHSHSVAIGAHSHTVGIGAHTHSVSGTTANVGSGSPFSVANPYVKLMGWYRSV